MSNLPAPYSHHLTAATHDKRPAMGADMGILRLRRVITGVNRPREWVVIDRADATWVRDLIAATQYMVLATTDGDSPWVAPVEPIVDEDLNFYYFSTPDAAHSRHIDAGGKVAAVMFGADQPAYTPTLTANLNAVQMEGTARRLDSSEYNEAVRGAIEFLNAPMPPYEVYVFTPTRFFVPAIQDGVNTRYEVSVPR